VKSAGNERAAGGHAQFELAPGGEVELTWLSEANHEGPDVLELWFPACDRLRFRIIDPNREETAWVEADGQSDHTFGTFNWCRLSYTKYHWDNGDSRVQLTLHRGKSHKVANGPWCLVVRADEIRSSGLVHAWLERDNVRPIKLTSHLSELCTLSIPGTARSVISVASIDASQPYKVASYSSAGPTRDGREKPDLAAPGEGIIAARGGTLQDVRQESGTSMATPHVTGAIALLFSRQERRRIADPNVLQLNANQCRQALTQSTQNFNGRFTREMGYGALDVRRLLAEFE
jgi:endonuclease G